MEIGGYRLAWVGFAEDEEEYTPERRHYGVHHPPRQQQD